MRTPLKASLLARFQRSVAFTGTLRGAVVFAVLVGLAVPTVLSFMIEDVLSQHNAREQLDQDLQRTTQVLALAMQGQLWEFSQSNAEEIVRSMVDDARFISVVVQDTVTGRPFVEFRRVAGATQEAVTAEHVIKQEGREIGRVTVSMTLEPYLASNRLALRWTMLRTSIMIGVALFLILLVLRRRLLNPIAMLTQAANRLAHEDFSETISLRYKDELGQVATAMEHMRLALLGAFEELRGKNEELTMHAARLEDRVAERTRELTQSNEELNAALESLKATQQGLVESEKLASLGRLVAGIAHELNTPLGNALTVISTLEDRISEFSKLLTTNTAKRSDLQTLVDETREGEILVQRNIERATELIRDFKQLAIDQTTDMRRRFDLGQIVQEVLNTIHHQFKRTPIHLQTSLTMGIPMDSFPGPLGQVITNLVLNALTHAFEGRETGRVLIECSQLDANTARIQCYDDGVGMSAEVRRRAFDPFFTTKFGSGGSGLGLHIVHTIVSGLLGGTIELHTTPGSGTTFIIDLPLVAPQADRQLDPQAGVEPSRRSA